MDVNEKSEENDKSEGANQADFVQDIFYLQADKAKVNDGDGDQQKIIVVKRLVGEELEKNCRVDPEPRREKENRTKDSQELKRILAVPKARKKEKAEKGKVTGQMLDSFSSDDSYAQNVLRKIESVPLRLHDQKFYSKGKEIAVRKWIC